MKAGPCSKTQQGNLPACSSQPLLNAERQAGKLWIPSFKVFWYDSTRGLNPKYTDCKADALTTAPSRRFYAIKLVFYQVFYQKLLIWILRLTQENFLTNFLIKSLRCFLAKCSVLGTANLNSIPQPQIRKFAVTFRTSANLDRNIYCYFVLGTTFIFLEVKLCRRPDVDLQKKRSSTPGR